MFIYLDQSDWVGLHEGKAPEAAARLREFGERGLAMFIVSCEHALETHKLRDGRSARLAFLRAFPGIGLTGHTTDPLLAADASRLASFVQGVPPTPIRLDLVSASGLSDEDFAQLMEPEHWSLRALRRWLMFADGLGRRARKGETKERRRASDGAVRALFRGDSDAFTRATQALGPAVGSVRRRVFDGLAPLAARLGVWGRGRGVVGPDKHRDRMFDHCVLSRLPEDVRRNPGLVQTAAKVWADARARAELVPSLAAFAAIHGALENDLARTVTEADLVDARHAVYAPFASVFTCDQRNEALVRKALVGAPMNTKVVRCGRLAEVVRLIRDHVGDDPGA